MKRKIKKNHTTLEEVPGGGVKGGAFRE